MAIDAAALGIGLRASLHQSRTVKRPRHRIGRMLGNRGLAYQDERPVDDTGIRMVGRDAVEPAKEIGRCANAREDRQQADQPQEFDGYGHDTHLSRRG